MKNAALRATFALLLVACVATPLVRSPAGQGSLEVLERWTLDARFRWRGPRTPHPDLALVVFDDATAERAGPLFERRAGWAKVLDAISAQHPKAIGVDAVFDSPERLLGEDLQRQVTDWKAARAGNAGDEGTAKLLEAIAAELSGDEVLAESVKRAGQVGLIVSETSSGQPDAPGLGKARYGQATPTDELPRTRGLVASRPEIVAGARTMGLAVVSEDETRTVRHVAFGRAREQGVYLPFAVAMVGLARGLNRGELAFLGPTEEVKLGEQTVSLENGGVWLDFAGPAGTVPTWSALDVVEGRLSKDALAGKVVLLGVTRFGYDLARTPFRQVPGVEVQATIIENLLSGRVLRRSAPTTDVALVLLLGGLVVALFASARVSPLARAVSSAALLGGWWVVTQVAFSRAGLWLPLVMPGLTVLACAMLGLTVSYVTEAGLRRQLRKAFGHYVGEDVLIELMEHPEKLSLGGEKRELTVFFSDIRDFTTLSEKLAPVELVSFLNTYLGPMTRAVLRQGGLLDKYIGDAVMAVFGAPVPRDDHAAQALRCVARMHEALKVLNEGPLKKFGLEVAIGVGVNTGPMVVGNMGSEERFDYTVAGDAVNLSSRLEGLSKVYGVFCLVGDGTRRAVGEGFVFRELDLVQVKGKHEAVSVHELLSVEGSVLSTRAELAAWTAGLIAFRAGKLNEARTQFGVFAAANPDDLAVKRYLERLAVLPDEAPADFNAVSAFKSK